MVRSGTMSFASPFPEVDIPSTSVYDYLFGGIDDADLDRVALIDAKSGRETTYREMVGRIDAFAGALAGRGIGVGDTVGLAVAEQLGIRRRLSRHSSLRRDGHHHQRAVHRQGHRQAADRFERQAAGHRHTIAGPGQRGCRGSGFGRWRRRRARRRRTGRIGPPQRHRSDGPRPASAGRQLRAVVTSGGAALQLGNDRQSQGRDADAPQPGGQRRSDPPAARHGGRRRRLGRAARSSISTE